MIIWCVMLAKYRKSLLIKLLSNLSEGTEFIPGQIMITITQINAKKYILRALILF